MAFEHRIVSKSLGIPAEWDDLCTLFLQTRQMLAHYERWNPCGQRYHLLFENGILIAGAITYSRVQNLLTFAWNIPSPIKINFIGIPASISPPGIIGAPEKAALLLDCVFKYETCATAVRLMPGIEFNNCFASIHAYRAALRASWRRRMDRIRKKGALFVQRRTSCDEFTDDHYRLYLSVLFRAAEKIETLSLDFFRNLPRPIELISSFINKRLVSWRIVLFEKNRYSFILGGHDYVLNDLHSIYFNNLYSILEEGISRNAAVIDFGQTAEDAKARLGANDIAELMLLHHSNLFLKLLFSKVSPFLAYRKKFPLYRIFRTDTL
jgi:hypothetical protein